MSIIADWFKRFAFGQTQDNAVTQANLFRVADARRLLEESIARQEPEHQKRELTGDIVYDLVMFAADGDPAVVEKLLASGADPNGRVPDSRMLLAPPGGFLALHAAARHGHLSIVRRLIEAGAVVDAQDQVGNTALCEAAGSGQAEVLSALIEAGADVNARGAFWSDMPPVLTPGCTPLALAARGGHLEIVRLLLAAGADPNTGCEDGFSVLEAAAERASDIVRILLEAGAQVNSQSRHGWTALMSAAMYGNMESAKLLLDAGVNVNAQDDEGKTALMLAAKEGYVEILRLLIEHGAEEDIADENGQTALDAAEPWPAAYSFIEGLGRTPEGSA